MMPSTIASRNLGTLFSRIVSASSSSSARSTSTFVRAVASTISSSNIANQTSFNNTTQLRHHAPTSINTSNAITRSFSSMGGMPRRGFPQYTIFGPDSALSIRGAMPQFRRAGSDGVSVERRGKLILEWIPRNNTGAGFAWNDKTIFSLSVEEVGLLVSQLPNNSVELSHPTYTSDGEAKASPVMQMGGDVIEKVFTVEPGDGSTLKFKVDYMMGGVGGQTPPGLEGLPSTPLEITIQAGEFEVFKSICQTSIPYLLGWNTCMDIASAAAISKGLSGGGGMY